MPQSFDVQGPLAALELPSSQGVQSFFYPANLTAVTNHYVRFDCAIFQDSKYQNGVSGGAGGPVSVGQNLANAVGNLAQLAGANLGGNINTILGSVGIQVGNGGPLAGSISSLLAGPTNITNQTGPQIFYQTFKGLRGIGNKKIVNHLYLYTPDTINFGYKNKWQTISLREEFGAFADGIAAGSDALSVGVGGNDKVSLGRGALNMAAAAGIPLMAGAKSGLDTTLALMGTPLNPMTETIYRETEPRDFQFEFIMYPQTQKESTEISNIIQQFAFHGAGELATNETGGFLIMPSVFDIKFMYLARLPNGQAREMENPWIRRISTCALTAITADMSPNGQWQAQEDGSPTAVRLTLSFTELDLMTKDRIVAGF